MLGNLILMSCTDLRKRDILKAPQSVCAVPLTGKPNRAQVEDEDVS